MHNLTGWRERGSVRFSEWAALVVPVVKTDGSNILEALN